MARKDRSQSTVTIQAPGGIVMEGYMLKKKRKRMQGLAKRYFILSKTGNLSYSFHPNSPIRDSVVISTSFIHASRKERAIHIDSGSTVMHMKALTTDDFDRWTIALRGFISGTVQESSARGGRVASMGPSATTDDPEQDNEETMLQQALTTAQDMAASIRVLEAVHGELKSYDTSQRVSPSLGAPIVHSPSQKLNNFLKKGSTKDEYFDNKSPTLHPPLLDSSQMIHQLGAALTALKTQQNLLTSILASTLIPRGNSPAPDSFNERYHSNNSTRNYASRGFGTIPQSRASSISLATSEDTDDYYEATSAMGEFVFQDDEDDDGSDEEEGYKNRDDVIDDDQYPDADEYVEVVEPSLDQIPEGEVAMLRKSTIVAPVSRRAQLPSPVSGDEFSMLSMLRKNVGKDLSTISFPVTFNEPLSALQRIAEELEYVDLLHKAAAATDPVERMVLVATFAISGSSGNKFRSSRKPFNPLLGETYECVRPDKGFKFISEKVSHHPPVMAFHAASTTTNSASTPASDDAWMINGHIAPSQKFWGRSFELMFPGNFSVTFRDTGETFNVVKPSSFVRNLVAGTKYLEIVGEMTILCSITNMRTVVNFKEGSSWGGSGSRNKIEAIIYNGAGKNVAELVGRWDESIDRKKGETGFERIWSIKEFQKNPEKYYGFSSFAIELNEITPVERDLLPSSDSRLRPDQIALEAGRVDEAESTKIRVEEKQREKRKVENDRGGHVAEYFKPEGDTWAFSGDYFTKRAARTLLDVNIF